jgi:hypothetical protein
MIMRLGTVTQPHAPPDAHHSGAAAGRETAEACPAASSRLGNPSPFSSRLRWLHIQHTQLSQALCPAFKIYLADDVLGV